MSNFPITTYRLAPRGPESRGLVCDQQGAMLGPAPLVFPVSGPGGRRLFQAVAAERLGEILKAAYGPDFRLDLAERTMQLQAVARALTENRMADALIGAVHLRLPELSEAAVQRLAALAKYSPDQPRVPKGNRDGGQWTREGGAAGDAARRNRNPVLLVSESKRDEGRTEAEFRRLTPGEIAMARSVFGDCIDYVMPKIYDANYDTTRQQKDGEIITPDGNMYVPKTNSAYRDDYSEGTPANKSQFIHEMTHILQFQHDVTVELDAFWEWAFGPGYDYRLKPGKRFEDYGIEQQAAIVEDHYRMTVLKQRPLHNTDYRDDKAPDDGRYLQAYKALLNVDPDGMIHVYGC